MLRQSIVRKVKVVRNIMFDKSPKKKEIGLANVLLESFCLSCPVLAVNIEGNATIVKVG